MKKILFLMIIGFSSLAFCQSKSEMFDWSFNGGGGFNSVKKLNYNSQGDLHFLMDAGHQTVYGGTTVSDPGFGSYPGTASFVGKRAQNGTSTVLIKKNIVNPTYATFHDFVIDNNDDIILTGATFGYDNSVFYDFGNDIKLYGKGNFIAKYNPQGVCQWAKLITYNLASNSAGENKNIALGVLPNNDIYYANRSTGYNANYLNPFWLIRFNTAGTELWHKEWLMPNSRTISIYTSKNNFFFDNTGKAYFIIQSSYGDLVTIDGIILTPPAGGHPTTTSLLTINGDGTNGVFSTHRGGIGDVAVEKETGNILLDWGQYNVNPAPFDKVSYNTLNQYGGFVALDSNRNYIKSSASWTIDNYSSIYPLGNLNFVVNSFMFPNETLTTSGQSYTATKHTPTWKFFENFEMTKFVSHPEITGTSTNSVDTMALYNNKLAVAGTYGFANNPTITINGTTLTSCNNSPNFATLYPSWASLQNDVFISQLSLGTTLSTVNPLKSNANIYPNPVNNQLNISFDKNVTHTNLKMINILGQIVYEKNKFSGNNLSIDCSNFSKGTYILSLVDGNFISNTKIIKL